MLRRLGLALLILSVVTWAGLVQAQPPRGGPGGGHRGHGGHGGPPGGGMMFRGGGMMGGGGGNSLGLLRIEQIQEELELVDDQKEQLKKIGGKLREEMRGMFSGVNFREMSQEERQAQFKKLNEKRKPLEEKYRKMVEDVLLPHQTERLEQIEIQMQGNRAISNQKVIKELKITDEQKKQFQAIREELGGKMREMFSGMRELEPEERQKRMAKNSAALQQLRKETEEKALGVLTSEQKEKLEKMKGKKFELDRERLMKSFQALRGQRGGPGGPPGRGEGGRGGPGGPRRGGPGGPGGPRRGGPERGGPES